MYLLSINLKENNSPSSAEYTGYRVDIGTCRDVAGGRLKCCLWSPTGCNAQGSPSLTQAATHAFFSAFLIILFFKRSTVK